MSQAARARAREPLKRALEKKSGGRDNHQNPPPLTLEQADDAKLTRPKALEQVCAAQLLNFR